MARRKSSRTASGFRRTRTFIVANLVLWGVIGGGYWFQPPERQQEVSRLVRNWADGRKNVTAFEVAWDLWQLYGGRDFVAAQVSERDFAYAGPPRTAKAVRVLSNTGYLVGYSDALGNPLWAAYRVHDVETLDAPERPDQFRVDPRTSARVEPGDYTRSGYDRGHLAPNYAIATRFGRRAQEETFLMSNIAPQMHALNAGAWRELEHKIATSYAARFGEVWVIAGPVFGESPEWLRGRVAVPEAFFMIVIDETAGRVRAQAFLFPQSTIPEARLEEHVVSIDAIEQRTGLDFLSALPDEAETALESMRASRVW